MYRKDSETPRWWFVPVIPEEETRFRHWSQVTIAVLAFLILGLFLAAGIPQPTNHTAASASHIKSTKHHSP